MHSNSGWQGTAKLCWHHFSLSAVFTSADGLQLVPTPWRRFLFAEFLLTTRSIALCKGDGRWTDPFEDAGSCLRTWSRADVHVLCGV